jgi:hypothetical protein
MDFSNNYNYSARFNFRRKNVFFPENIKIKSNCLNQEKDALLSRKLSIENLLDIVKKFQINLISNNPHNLNIINTKLILSLFKDSLSNDLNNKQKVLDELNKQNDKKKRNIRHMIKTNNERSKNDINYKKETEQLKYFNFNIENEINKIDFMIKEKKALKKIKYIDELDQQIIYCEPNNKNEMDTLKIMNEEKNELNQKFINLNNEKKKMDAEIKDVKNIKSIIDNAINGKEKGNINFDFLFQKSNALYLSKNNSNSYSSDKETNVSSVKNVNVYNFNAENNNNFDYLKNGPFFDLDNNKTLKSFHSSLDNEFD